MKAGPEVGKLGQWSASVLISEGEGLGPMATEVGSLGETGGPGISRDHVPAAVATSCGLILVNPVCHALICIAVTIMNI